MLFLRTAKESDFNFYLSLKSEPESILWGGFLSPPSPERLQSVFLDKLKDQSRQIWIALDHERQQIGYIEIVQSTPKIAEISYAIRQNLAGKGFGTQLIKKTVEHIKLSHPKTRHITAWIHEQNLGSIKIARRNGFEESKETRDANFQGTTIKIRKFVYPIERVLIIGEAGVNHNGDIHLAKKLIDVAVHSGIDIVKFQTWKTEELVDKSAPKAAYQIANDSSVSQFEMLKKLELSYPQFVELKAYAESAGIEFLSTPDDYPSLDFLSDQLNLSLLKVGSGELTNIPFLRKIGRKGKDVILSTGMGNLSEVEKAYETLLESGSKTVSLLHCTSNYPALMNSINLHSMDLLRRAFGCKVGYSDHTEGIEVSVAAVALGAQIIEKHYTTDRSLPGPDHLASICPEELTALVKSIRNVELAIAGNGRKQPHESELETKTVVSKGIYAKTDIAPNTTISETHLQLKRPATSLAPHQIDLIIDQTAKRFIPAGTPITLGDIDFE